MGAQNSEELEVLYSMVNNLHVGFDLDHIEKVLPLVSLETVPGSPGYVVGLMNYSGKSIFVVDLALRLGFSRHKRYSLDTPIILCKNNIDQTAIVVDKVIGLSVVKKELLQVKDKYKENKSPIDAVVEINSRLVFMINIPEILSATDYDMNYIKKMVKEYE
jgi:purine-binding chemotaxis protein CheW